VWRHLTIDGGGWPLVVRCLGEGPPIVLLAALGRPAIDFDVTGEVLARRGHLVAAIEFRGIGGSGGPMGNLTLDDYAGDVELAVRRLDLAPCHLVGAPFGSRVARLVCTRNPDLVRSVTLIAAGGIVPPDPPTVARARAFMTGIVAGHPAAALAEIARDVYFSPSFRIAAGWMEGCWLPSFSAHGLVAERAALHASGDPVSVPAATPVLILQGRDDRIAPPVNAHRLKAALGGRARLVEFEQAGHMLLLERPRDVADAIADFLADLAEDPGRDTPAASAAGGGAHPNSG